MEIYKNINIDGKIKIQKCSLKDIHNQMLFNIYV